MEIELTNTEIEVLASQAGINGFDTAEAFAAELLGSYTEIAGQDDAAIHASSAALEMSHKSALAGRSRDLNEALADIAARYSLPVTL